MRVTVEALKKREVPGQCYRCQMFGHSQTNCTGAPRCVRCAGSHRAQECKVPDTHKPKCANCAGEHPASYGGCPHRPKARRPGKHTESPRQISNPRPVKKRVERQEKESEKDERERKKRRKESEDAGEQEEGTGEKPGKETGVQNVQNRISRILELCESVTEATGRMSGTKIQFNTAEKLIVTGCMGQMVRECGGFMGEYLEVWRMSEEREKRMSESMERMEGKIDSLVNGMKELMKGMKAESDSTKERQVPVSPTTPRPNYASVAASAPEVTPERMGLGLRPQLRLNGKLNGPGCMRGAP
nr:unnamed protein product [Callosobruchus chinensis]